MATVLLSVWTNIFSGIWWADNWALQCLLLVYPTSPVLLTKTWATRRAIPFLFITLDSSSLCCKGQGGRWKEEKKKRKRKEKRKLKSEKKNKRKKKGKEKKKRTPINWHTFLAAPTLVPNSMRKDLKPPWNQRKTKRVAGLRKCSEWGNNFYFEVCKGPFYTFIFSSCSWVWDLYANSNEVQIFSHLPFFSFYFLCSTFLFSLSFSLLLFLPHKEKGYCHEK